MPRGVRKVSPSMDAMALREMAKIMDMVHAAKLEPDNMDFLASRIMSIASDRRKIVPTKPKPAPTEDKK